MTWKPEGIVERRQNGAYDGKIKALMQRAGLKEEFAAWLEALRLKHKAKQNFMQRIDGLR